MPLKIVVSEAPKLATTKTLFSKALLPPSRPLFRKSFRESAAVSLESGLVNSDFTLPLSTQTLPTEKYLGGINSDKDYSMITD